MIACELEKGSLTNMFGKKKKNEYEEVVEEGRDEFDVDYNDDEDFETDFISLDEDEDEKPKRGGIGKKVGITFGVILAVQIGRAHV